MFSVVAEEWRLFSILQRVISSSDFEVKCVVPRCDLGLTFLYIENKPEYRCNGADQI